MGESGENCSDRRKEPDPETVELLGLIQKYPVSILALLVSPHTQEYTYSNYTPKLYLEPKHYTK